MLFTREIRNQGTLRSETVLLDLRTREQRVLIPEGSGARYVATGHLVYAVGDTLRAVGFDLATQAVRGSPVPVLDGVMSTAQAAPNFSVSSNRVARLCHVARDCLDRQASVGLARRP